MYFEGNNEVNYDNYTQDGGNWGRFDPDADSNWVGLTDDVGTPEQASCIGSACSISSLEDMGADYSARVDPNLYSHARGAMFGGISNHWNFRLDNAVTPSDSTCKKIARSSEFLGGLAGVLTFASLNPAWASVTVPAAGISGGVSGAELMYHAAACD